MKLYGRNAQASGPAFWQAAEEVLGRPVVVMCGDRAGTVLAALRVGCRHLHHTVQGPAAAALTALIAAHGAREAPELPHVVLTAHPQVTAQIARWRFEHSDQFRRGCYESAHLSHDPNSNGMTPCD
ncbi:MAG: hypothetical protein EA356_02555 [Geminicoccaceae bacterium]|nr:MAG: hypothetical protein EA356_02555 [Geminicoccaceae bacterium]